MLLSAVVAAWQSIDRFIHPQLLQSVGWVIVAGLISFAGNEAVAIYRIRIGRSIGSAAQTGCRRRKVLMAFPCESV